MIELLDRIEILNGNLQNSEYCVIDSYQKVEAVIDSLSNSRDSKFEIIWEKACNGVEKFDIEEPSLPRCKRIPKRLLHSSNANVQDHAFQTPKDMYRKLYYEVYDQFLTSIFEK